MAGVLVVDDNEAIGGALAKLLRAACGIETHHVTSGGAALCFVHDHPIEAVVLDLMMPGMTGFEVLRRIRGTDETKDLPVIIYSALDEPAAIEEIKRLGAQEFILKGSHIADICKAVMRLKLT